MLRVSFSNRFETLLDALLDALADPPSSPFASQQVIVPSMAVRRKVELATAERFGICANVEFAFLAAWLWRQIGRLVPVAEQDSSALAALARADALIERAADAPAASAGDWVRAYWLENGGIA